MMGSIIALVMVTMTWCGMVDAQDYTPRVHIVTCETRADAAAHWHLTVQEVNGAAEVQNVCEGLDWGGTIMKPRQVIEYMETLLAAGAMPDDLIMFVDGADALFNLGSTQELVAAYKTAAAEKPILVSTELTCWVGDFCSISTASLLYPLDRLGPTRSNYVNAGAFMGPIQDLMQYLHAVVIYYDQERAARGGYMDDQMAFAHLATSYEWRQSVALDTTWQVFGSLLVAKPQNDTTPKLPMYYPRPGYKFTCTAPGSDPVSTAATQSEFRHVKGCYQVDMPTKQFLSIDQDTCSVYYNVTAEYAAGFAGPLQGLNKQPLVLHANGRFTKRVFITVSQWKHSCIHARRARTAAAADGPVPVSSTSSDSSGSSTPTARVPLVAPEHVPAYEHVPALQASTEKLAFVFITRGVMPHEEVERVLQVLRALHVPRVIHNHPSYTY